MKRFISYLLLFSIFLIGFIHHSMMAFAMDSEESMVMKFSSTYSTMFSKEAKSDNCTTSSCCIEESTEYGVFNVTKHDYKKISKLLKDPECRSREDDIIKLLEIKSLTYRDFWPYFERNIQNYFYHTLIKIVKSNT